MDKVDLYKWITNFNKQVYEKWKAISERNIIIKTNGFATFYSPVYYNPDILIFGFNPAGDFKKDNYNFNPNEAIIIPENHDYLTEDYEIARKMRDLFCYNKGMLEKSVKTNFYYFRTKSAVELKSMNCFKEIEEFCRIKTIEIIEILKPKIIICEGIETFDLIINLLNITNNEPPILSEEKCRIFLKTRNDIIKVIGIIHPSGGRTRNIFNKYFKAIQENLRNEIEI